ncbi:FUSC family protein [Streptomyces sp. NPDC088752]|uniref:FUSC family protein n=1 Tax=Streptomyces sp. NPDC088752 TaxID=3154963 RepID=UPI00344A14FA
MAEGLSAVARTGRHAAHVTAATAAGFYPALHLLDRPVTGIYALFTPIAFGILSPLPGAGRDRAATVLRAVPAAAVLVVLGTVLAVGTWPAVAGMLAVGFALAFGAACGPRIAGAAPGLQLFYILACFPPYEPGTLPQRLAGLVVGGVLLALAEAVFFPDAPEPSYRGRIADALDLAARAASGVVRGEGPDPETAGRLGAAGRELRLSRLPAGARPTGAGRTDRALAQAGAATRRLLDQLALLAAHDPAPGDTVSAELLRGIAANCTETAEALRRGDRGRRARRGRPLPGPQLLEEMVADFLKARGAWAESTGASAGRRAGATDDVRAGATDDGPAARTAVPDPPAPALRTVLVRRSTVLTAAVSAVTVRTAASLALGGRERLHGLPHEQFWYAAEGTARLVAVRVRGNLTRRSVVFQNALRTALGLALARLVAGSLDLTHGFWVLLAVLTLGRTTAGATWSAVRAAAAGTLAGAFAAGLLIVGAGGASDVYAALLVPMMLVAFTLGPLGGPSWGQGLFTLVVATAFAQIAPVTWRLAEARLVDVLTGSAIGLLCGLLAWPAGARAEIRYGMSGLLRAAAPVVRATTAAVTDGSGEGAPQVGSGEEAARGGGREGAPRAGSGEGAVPAGEAEGAGPASPGVRLTLHRLRIAEAVYAQYRTEPAADAAGSAHDWLSVLDYGARTLVGAYWLPRTDGMPGLPADARRWAHETAEEVVAATVRAAGFPPDGVRVRPAPLPPEVAERVPAPLLAPLTDVEVWLHALARDLEAGSPPEPEDRKDRPGRTDRPEGQPARYTTASHSSASADLA